MGEGCAGDRELMAIVSSANIACGFHAGDRSTMRQTVDLAVKHGVAVGAHPSFRDREGFGRRTMNVDAGEVFDIVTEQINALKDICAASGTGLRHVKPHGALYNQAAKDEELARAIASAVIAVDDTLILFGLAGSLLISEGIKCGLRTASEAFADRTYQADGSLTPRTAANALITDSGRAVEQVLGMIDRQMVTTIDGQNVSIAADTICIHGDGPHAVEFANAVRDKLIEHGVAICPVYDL